MKRKGSNGGLGYVFLGLLFLSTGVLYHTIRGGGSSILEASQETSSAEPSPVASSVQKIPDHVFVRETKNGDELSQAIVPHSVDSARKHYKECHLYPGASEPFSVPQLFCAKLPNMREMKKPAEKRQLFIQMILPLLLKRNDQILTQRTRLLGIAYRKRQGLPLTAHDMAFIADLSQEYSVPTRSLEALLKRVDIVPPSLALAQAILETGCGTSVAALRKCSIFGHMATSTQVASFPNLWASIHTYTRNLCRNRAYRGFQDSRAAMRSSGKNPCGYSLANGLVKYSERGKHYIKDLQKIILMYDLKRFDRAYLQTR
jgi:Bax protein